MWVFSNFSTILTNISQPTFLFCLSDIAKVNKIDLGIGLDKPQQFVNGLWPYNRSKNLV